MLLLLFVCILSCSCFAYKPRKVNSEIDFSKSSSALPSTIHNRNNWISKDGTVINKPQINDKQLKIITYNILGPLHGESSKHYYAPVQFTRWSKRREKLCEELGNFNADILCLQEVSNKALKETFIPYLKPFGLECISYSPSNMASDITNNNGKYGHKQIGCAIFSRTSKVNLISSKRCYLRDFIPTEQSKCDLLKTDMNSLFNSMAMTCIELQSTKQLIIVANTHIYWNPVRPDIKSLQTLSVLNSLHKYQKECTNDTAHIPIILCGDLNTTPDIGYSATTQTLLQSGPFELLSNGFLDVDHPQHPDKVYTTLGRNISPRMGPLLTTLLPSVNTTVEPHERKKLLYNSFYLSEYFKYRPLFTTKTDDFQGWIDHIWVDKTVNIDMVLIPPIINDDLDANRKARAFNPIPDKHYPSDHLPLGIIANFDV